MEGLEEQELTKDEKEALKKTLELLYSQIQKEKRKEEVITETKPLPIPPKPPVEQKKREAGVIGSWIRKHMMNRKEKKLRPLVLRTIYMIQEVLYIENTETGQEFTQEELQKIDTKTLTIMAEEYINELHNALD